MATAQVLHARGLSRGLVLSLLIAASPASAVAAIRYVSTTGTDAANDCVDSGAPCATLQHAVDSADDLDEVRVAAGSYTGSATVTVTRASNEYDYRQVLFIGKPLSVRGGYLETDWNTSDPQTNATAIDADGDGRPVSVVDTGDGVVTLAGFTLRGGDSTGLGNPPETSNHVCRSGAEQDCGGGLYVYNSALVLEACEVSDNVASTVAGDGGGIYLWRARATTLADVLVRQNQAPYSGGGLHAEVQNHPLAIADAEFIENTADRGGGVSLATNIENPVTITRSTLSGNSATGVYGGGGALYARLTTNGDVLTLDEVVISDNTAWGRGKALLIESAGLVTPHARLTNILLSDNGPVPGAPASDEDAVVALGPGFTHLEIDLAHVTAAGNAVDTFMYVEPYAFGEPPRTINVRAVNTLLSGFVTGFAAREAREPGNGEASVTDTRTLFHEVTNPHLALEGTPEFIAIEPLSGDPMLDVDYRLQAGSAALDQGIDAGVARDLDGDHRPQGLAPDIGADEFLEIAAPALVTLSGPSSVQAGVEAVFLAEVAPPNATQPLTYEWSATDLGPLSRPGGLSDTAGFTWLVPGPKSVTVTVSNGQGEASESWLVTVVGEEIFWDGFEATNGQAEAR